MDKQLAWDVAKTMGLWALGGVYLGFAAIVFIRATRPCIPASKFRLVISNK